MHCVVNDIYGTSCNASAANAMSCFFHELLLTMYIRLNIRSIDNITNFEFPYDELLNLVLFQHFYNAKSIHV